VRFVEVAGRPDSQPSTKPKTMALEQGSIQVDPGLTGQLDPAQLLAMKDTELKAAGEERDALAARLREASQELDGANRKVEASEGELKKLRGEVVSQRERLNEMTRQKALGAEELHAQTKVAEELREELSALRDEHLTVRGRNDELSEEVAARDRQLERAHEDLQRAKQTTDELRGALGEVQKTKDEGWRELNERVGELDHLREVIAEQERILEERRVGLISLESTTKDVRADKEKLLRELVAVKTERDELRDHGTRLQHQIEALEEEHRRLARAIADGGGSAPAGDLNEEHVRLATELRELKIDHRKLETDRARLVEQVARLEAEQAQLDDRHAKTDVARAHLEEEKASAQQARTRIEEALARAETARQRADEERAQAAKARDAALASADEQRREADRARRKVVELEQQLYAAAGPVNERSTVPSMPVVTAESLGGLSSPPEGLAGMTMPSMPIATMDTDPGEAQSPEARIAQLEEELGRLGTELAIARSDHELKRRAEEVYTGINDALSELRTNILLARDLLEQHGPAVPTLAEAIQLSMDRAEDAKGLLRSLREMIDT
jgi:chromosome segregation ATPase